MVLKLKGIPLTICALQQTVCARNAPPTFLNSSARREFGRRCKLIRIQACLRTVRRWAPRVLRMRQRCKLLWSRVRSCAAGSSVQQRKTMHSRRFAVHTQTGLIGGSLVRVLQRRLSARVQPLVSIHLVRMVVPARQSKMGCVRQRRTATIRRIRKETILRYV